MTVPIEWIIAFFAGAGVMAMYMLHVVGSIRSTEIKQSDQRRITQR